MIVVSTKVAGGIRNYILNFVCLGAYGNEVVSENRNSYSSP